jgi:hypothetical protein
MNKIILAPCDFISKIKQNSSDMNEIILASCDAGYVQNCTGLVFFWCFNGDFCDFFCFLGLPWVILG